MTCSMLVTLGKLQFVFASESLAIYFTQNLKVTSSICKSVDGKHVQSSQPNNTHTLKQS